MGIQQLEHPVADAKVSAPSLHQRNTKIDSLTGLRFIAASLVFMAHTPVSPAFPVFVRSFTSSGGNGVTLFFILSGFVLCFNYYDAFSTRFAATLKSFFVARFARIYPLHFLLFLLFFASAGPILLQLQHFQLILAQLTLTQAWSSDLRVVNSYNGVSWSVSVEAFLYLCFPLLVLLLFKHATKIRHLYLIGFVAFSAIFLLATCVSLYALYDPSSPAFYASPIYYWLYIFPATRLGDFILGCVAARIYVLQMSKSISPREQVLGVTLLLLSIAAVVSLMGIGKAFLIPYKYDAGYSLFFAIIIYALARYISPLSKLLSTKLFVLLGEASYAFYLLHIPILYFGLTLPYLSGHLIGDLYVVMQFLLTVVVALGAYTYVETPLRKKIRQVFASRASIGSSMPTING